MKELNASEFKELVINSSDLTLVDFSATWCGPCQMQRPVLEEMEQSEPFNIYSIDVDKVQDIAASYNINAVPTLMIFKNGSLKQTLVGFQSKEAIKSAIEKYQ